jgi:hypothetical protein
MQSVHNLRPTADSPALPEIWDSQSHRKVVLTRLLRWDSAPCTISLSILNDNKFDGLLKTFARGVTRIKTNNKSGVGQFGEAIVNAS